MTHTFFKLQLSGLCFKVQHCHVPRYDKWKRLIFRRSLREPKKVTMQYMKSPEHDSGVNAGGISLLRRYTILSLNAVILRKNCTFWKTCG